MSYQKSIYLIGRPAISAVYAYSMLLEVLSRTAARAATCQSAVRALFLPLFSTTNSCTNSTLVQIMHTRASRSKGFVYGHPASGFCLFIFLLNARFTGVSARNHWAQRLAKMAIIRGGDIIVLDRTINLPIDSIRLSSVGESSPTEPTSSFLSSVGR